MRVWKSQEVSKEHKKLEDLITLVWQDKPYDKIEKIKIKKMRWDL